MSKVITSPVKRWPGSVTLADPLTFPQYITWKDTLANAPDPKADYERYCDALLPGVRVCVEQWALEGKGAPSAVFFPATPRLDSDQMLGWLVREIRALITGADDPDPNSPPPSMAGS